MLIVVLWLYLLVVHAQDIVRIEGDICMQKGHVQSVCKTLRHCPGALQDLKEDRRPSTCGFMGSEILVCCTLRPTLEMSPIPIASPKPLTSSTPRASSKPIVSSRPLANSKPMAGSHPLSNSKPMVNLHEVTSSKPMVSSHLLANSKPTVSSHPLANSKPMVGSHPLASSKPMVSLHEVTSSKPMVSSHPLASSKPIVSSRPIAISKPTVSSKPIARPKPQETGKGRSISEQKCEEYAKYIRIKAANHNGNEGTVDTCGFKDPPLLGGFNPVQPGAYPHMALIGYGEKNIKWLCGGTLISESFVLSAAHCADAGQRGEAKWVRLGDYDIASKKDDDSGYARSSLYGIKEIFIHPEYKSSGKYNDIALYSLDDFVEFGEFIRPICLQTEHHITENSAIYTAWGETGSDGRNVLKESNLVIVPENECNGLYKKDSFKKILTNFIDNSSMLCAARRNEGDSCRERDTEGPLQIRLRQPYCMYSQLGIVSLDRRCASNFPSIFTRVSRYVPWIESIVWPYFTLRVEFGK